MKSNINIASNVYIRTRENVTEDRNFVKAVQGAEALKLLRDDYLYGLAANMQLSDLQKQELEQGTSCGWAANGEITHGKIYRDGSLEWMGRCEYAACSKFATCPAAWQIIRELPSIEPTVKPSSEFEFLGVDLLADVDIAPDQQEIETCETILETHATSVIETTNNDFYKRFQCINSPERIITAPLDSKILVNAAPGTGKTYSVIQRLLYILQNNLAQPEEILILCYSRAAVKVIRSRIAQSVDAGELPEGANKLGVFTFDWFASKYLAEIELEFTGFNYNERIEAFNNQIDAQYFTKEYFRYLIVDELQDLVNARAQMVLEILAVVQCGYLLLGDACQAIYDFDSNDTRTLSSVDFYQQLLDILPEDTMYYELMHNKRQTTELAELTTNMRQVLLQDTPIEQNTYANAVMKKLPIFAKKTEELLTMELEPEKSTAILCRNNGDVLHICGILCQEGVEHRILRGNMSKPKYQRFLADVFWDFVEGQMSQTEFCRRYMVRVNADEREAMQRFSELCALTDAVGRRLNIADLRRVLLQTETIDSLTINEASRLVVSTIHRAKGQEFDNVYLLQYSPTIKESSNSEEARVRYVAMSRAKIKLQKISISFSIICRTEKARHYRIAYRGKYYNSDYWCSGISVCHDEHLEPLSFVNENLHDNVFANQQYIAEHVQRFDELEAVYNQQDKLYYIMHKDVKIGTLATNSAAKFWDIVCRTSDRRNIPAKLTNLFVYDVYTVIEKGHNDNLTNIHKQSRIWLGVDIVGMGRTNYNDYS